MHAPNDEINTFSPVSEVDVEESCFFNVVLKIPYQSIFLMFLSFMNTCF